MQIKLPHMPFKFDSPEGRMEITVRPTPAPAGGDVSQYFVAALNYLQAGPRALERIPLAARAPTYRGALDILVTGFKVNPNAHPKDTAEHRVLSALCAAEGVTDLNAP